MVSFLKKLFGGGAPAEAAPVEAKVAETYKGFGIIPTPRKEGSQWRLAGRIVKDGPDGQKAQDFVRADLFSGEDEARSFAIVKAKLMIDQMGDRLFD